jgi:hypothetical protein
MDGVYIADRNFRIEFMNQDLLYQSAFPQPIVCSARKG